MRSHPTKDYKKAEHEAYKMTRQMTEITCRSGGNAAGGLAMMGPTSFTLGGSGRG